MNLKKIGYSILYICFLLLFLSTLSGESFLTLGYQMKINTPSIKKMNSALKLIRKYISSQNSEIKLGMKLILHEKEYRKKRMASKVHFKIDGVEKEWETIPNTTFNPKNNILPGNFDLTKTSYWINERNELLVLHKSRGKPKFKKFSQVYSVSISPKSSRHIILYIIYSPGMKRAICKIKKYGRVQNITVSGIEFAINSVAEVRIKLKYINKLFNEKSPEAYFVTSSINSFSGKRYSDRSKIFTLPYKPKNYALELLVHLLESHCFDQDDPAAISIALANNYLYSIGDEQTRVAIKRVVDFSLT